MAYNSCVSIFCFIFFLSLLTGFVIHSAPWSNVWAVRIDGGEDVARMIARKNNHEYLGKVEGLDNVYMMKAINVGRRQRRSADNVTLQLNEIPQVIWAEQQQANIRVKRDFFSDKNVDSIQEQYQNLFQSSSFPRENNELSFKSIGRRSFESFIKQVFENFGRKIILQVLRNQTDEEKKEKRAIYNDELWPHQWYITQDGFQKHDHGITRAWDMGYTGRGVVVTVLDDGLEWKHSDLKNNYDHNASFDMNDNDDDPTPRYDFHDTNAHGTRCAGEIAMAPHNKKCGVGIAYNARIGGIRCLDGDLTDLDEARALSFRSDYIDIYSSSWGPADDGKTVDGPRILALEALERGISKGRQGKGSLYVWASGNGGAKGDNCNCDGYVSSIYTISIGSVSESGQFPWYGEKCASTLAVAYSSGAFQERKIATTDIHDGCTMDHSGTSAAAPIAAGILALVLEANGNLTWRDVQHLIACTAEYRPLADNEGWKQNGAGFLFSSQFGFGLLSADSMIEQALKWETVAPKHVCVIRSTNKLPVSIVDSRDNHIVFEVNNCPIRYLEHVQVRVNIQTNRRGMLKISLKSPMNTESILMHPRLRDSSTKGFDNWNLTSVQFWGENPLGIWKFEIHHLRKLIISSLKSAELIIHGVTEPVGCLKGSKNRRDQIKIIIQTNTNSTDKQALNIVINNDDLFNQSKATLTQDLNDSKNNNGTDENIR